MIAVYHTNSNELSFDFFQKIKEQFKNKAIDIVVRDFDETTYLNSSKVNRKRLEESIKEIEEGKVIVKSLEELEL